MFQWQPFKIDWFSSVTDKHGMHVSTLDGVSVLIWYSFPSDPATYKRLLLGSQFGAWSLINYSQTAIEHLPVNEDNFNWICLSISIDVYPIIILNVDISSFITKVSHYFDMATFSCQVQGSHLMERKKTTKVSHAPIHWHSIQKKWTAN